jgi:hypothetical protein
MLGSTLRLGIFMHTKTRARFVLSCVAAAASLSTGYAFAHNAPLGDEGEIRYNFTANYGIAQRLEAPDAAMASPDPADPLYIGKINSNDGNLNFKKNAIINNRLSLLGEADIRYTANQGVFLRAQAFYDAAYHGKTDNLSTTDNHATGAAEFARGTRRAAGGEAEFLDAYWYGDFKTGEDSALNVKVGRHVVQWGEGLFFSNIAGAQSPVDVNKINVPGAQVKDFLLPVGQVSVNYSLNPQWTLMGYAQYEFREAKLPAAGSFWSVADFLGPGAERFLFAPGFGPTRSNDIKPSASGQWGLGGRYITDNSSEFGFYHLRYHSRAPSLQINGPDYQVVYQKDIKLTGASVSTRVGDAAVAGEISYKQNTPIWVMTPLGANNYNPADPNAYRGNVWQAQVNSTYIMSPNALASGGMTLLGELVYQRTTSNKSSLPLANSKDAAAISVMAIPSYPNVFDGWDLQVPISYMQAISGNNAASCAGNCHATFPNGDSLTLLGVKEKRLSLGAQMTYMANLKLGVSYTKFLGKPDYQNNPIGDRDNIAFNVTYNF